MYNIYIYIYIHFIFTIISFLTIEAVLDKHHKLSIKKITRNNDITRLHITHLHITRNNEKLIIKNSATENAAQSRCYADEIPGNQCKPRQIFLGRHR